MSFLGKEYKLEKEENFDGFLASIDGISAEDRAKFAHYKPTQKLEKDGDSYKYTTVSPRRPKLSPSNPVWKLKMKSGKALR
ncbi:fatty acid-binding protein 1-like [Aphomia sociella]